MVLTLNSTRVKLPMKECGNSLCASPQLLSSSSRPAFVLLSVLFQYSSYRRIEDLTRPWS